MKTLILATAALLAAPALAQTTAPTPPQAPAAGAAPQRPDKMRMVHVRRGPMFGNVSPEGRQILREAMRGSAEDGTAVRTARDKVNGIVGADKLDVNALKRAMDEERRLVDSQHARRQQALLAAIQKLTPEDRKAFAADAAKARINVEKRTAEWRKGGDNRRPETPPAQ